MILKVKNYILFCFCIFGSLSPPLFSSSITQSEYTSELNKTRLITDFEVIEKGQSFWAMMEIIPKAGWHTYWKNPGDSGMPISFEWQQLDGINIENILWLPPKRIPIAHLVNYGYPRKAYYLIKINVGKGYREKFITLKLNASWLVCKEECIPDKATYTLKIEALSEPKRSTYYSLIHKVLNEATSLESVELKTFSEDKNVYFELPNSIKSNNLYLFLEEEGLIPANATQEVISRRNIRYLKVAHDFALLKSGIEGFLRDNEKEEEKVYKVKLSVINELPPSILLTIIAFAFLGGIILNAMPCVLPVLFLKIYGIVRQRSYPRKEIILHSLSYTIGVLLSFLLLSIVLIFIKFTGQEVGWGFQLQSPLFVFLLSLLFLLIGFNFLSFYEFKTFSFSSSSSPNHKYLNEFLTGMLTVLVASPCTAPFMATSIGIALSQSNAIIFLIFFFLGLGLAAPYLVISSFPKLSLLLPQPGNWMITFKKLLSIPIFATTIWLLWVLHYQIRPLELYYIIFFIILISLAIILIKFLKYKYCRYILVFLILCVGSYAGFLSHNSKKKSFYVNDRSISDLKSLIGKKDIFVNITASWCITCKVNESLVLKDDSLMQAFKSNNVEYITLDWTNRNDEITRFMKQYNRRGVPVYLFIRKNREVSVLPQLLTKSIIMGHLNLQKNKAKTGDHNAK